MKYVVWIIVIAALIFGGYYYRQKNQGVEAPKNEVKNEQNQEEMKQDEERAQEEKKDEKPEEAAQPADNKQTTGPASAVQEISMTSGYAFFTPKEMTFKKGSPVKLTIQNSGSNHTFTIDELGVDRKLANGVNVIEFTPETAGVFIYYCATPGHRQAGQWGTVTVEE